VGCFTANTPYALYGLSGAHFQLFSHGIITALLFAVAGAVYGRTHTRDLRGWGGLAAKMPRYTFFYVLAAMGSLGLPGLTGFWAEFMVILGAYGTIPILAVCVVPGLLLTTMFLLRSVQYGFFGPLSPDHDHLQDASWKEMVAFLTLSGTALIFGVLPSLITSSAAPALLSIIPGGRP